MTLTNGTLSYDKHLINIDTLKYVNKTKNDADPFQDFTNYEGSFNKELKHISFRSRALSNLGLAQKYFDSKFLHPLDYSGSNRIGYFMAEAKEGRFPVDSDSGMNLLAAGVACKYYKAIEVAAQAGCKIKCPNSMFKFLLDYADAKLNDHVFKMIIEHSTEDQAKGIDKLINFNDLISIPTQHMASFLGKFGTKENVPLMLKDSGDAPL